MARRAPADVRRHSGQLYDGVVMKMLLLLLLFLSLCITEVSCQGLTSTTPGFTFPTSKSTTTTSTKAAITTVSDERTTASTRPKRSTTTPGFTLPPVSPRTTASTKAVVTTVTTSTKTVITTVRDDRTTDSTTTKSSTTARQTVSATPKTGPLVASPTTATSGSSTPTPGPSVRPLFGPVAGGTRVTITGQDLNVSTIVAVHFGHHRVVDISVEGDSIVAITPPVNETANLTIALELFNQSAPLNTGFMFDYRPNPTVANVTPRSHLLDGGTAVTVSGGNLSSVAEPRIVITTVVTYFNGTNATSSVNVTRKYYSKPCKFPDAGGTRMTCVIPRFVDDQVVRQLADGEWNATDGPGVAALVAADNSQRIDVFFGIQFDGYKRYENIRDELPDMKFQFPPPPTVSCPKDVVEVNPDKDMVISIQGENLMRASSKQDFKITIGDGVCVVTQLTNERVDCKPPSTKPNKKVGDTRCDEETMSLQVMIGNRHYPCSCVRYLSPRHLNIGMIIGVCIAVFIVTLFLIFLIFVLVECVCCGPKKYPEPEDQNL